MPAWWRRFRSTSPEAPGPAEAEASARYRDLVENSLGLICTHAVSGTFLSINPAGADLLGYSPAEIVGRNLRDILAPAVRPLLDEYQGRLRQLTSDSAVEIAQRSILRLVTLVNDILDIERIEQGQLALRVGSHSLASILASSVEEVGPLAREVGIGLEVNHPPGAVEGDGDRLVQVIVNLLSNALKFSPRGSTVRLRAWETPDGVEVQVEDQGRGIPASHRDAIFERFRQVEVSDAAGQRGAGLGLSMARSIVEMHGGQIGVESEPGRGSTFWFRIPRDVDSRA